MLLLCRKEKVMLHRDENGAIVSADRVSDVTDALKEIEKKISKAMKKKDSLSETEDAELAASAADLKVLLSLVTPEMQKTAKPAEIIGYVKQVVGIKKIADALKENKDD